MIATGYDKFRFGNSARDDLEGLNHQLKALVGSPFAERENSMQGIAAP
jgi:hypothetical protein